MARRGRVVCLNLAVLNSFPDPYEVGHVDIRGLPDADVVPDEVLAAYGLSDATVTRLTTGSYNIHFKVESDRGVFDLRHSNRPIDRSNLRYETEFLSHLVDRGFQLAPEPVATAGGEFNHWHGKGGWTLFKWVDVSAGDADVTANARRIESAARTLAAIHTATADFSPESRRGDWPIFSTPEEWKAKWASRSTDLAGHLGEDGKDLAELSVRATEEVAAVEFSRLPRFGCHGDYRMRNVHFRGDEVQVVFDFDTAMVSTRLLDLGGAVTRFSPLAGTSSRPQADVDSGSRFLRAYNETLPLEPYEWEVLPAFIRWRLLRDVNIYFDRWWLIVGDACRELFAGAADAMVASAR